MRTYIYKATIDGFDRNILTFLQQDEVFSNGLQDSFVVAYVHDVMLPLSPSNVSINPVFVRLFHHVIQRNTFSFNDYKEAALKQGKGYIYVIDNRDLNYPNTQPYDIVGAFPINDGIAQEEEYQPNPNYQLISKDGLFDLPLYDDQLLAAMRLQ